MEFTNTAWGTTNTKQNSALEILVKSEKNKLTSSLEAIEAPEAQGRRNKQTSALEDLHTSALDALVQSEKKLIADLKVIEALEAQMQRSGAPVAEETRDADNTKPGYGSIDQPKMMHMPKENPPLYEKSPASHITEDMPKIWDRVMNMPGLSNEEKRQLWMMILNGSTQNAGGREDAESTEGSTTSTDETIFEEPVVLPPNEAEEVASQIAANTVFQFANNFISNATEVVSQAIAPTKEDEDTSKADAPPIVDIDLPSPTAESVAEKSANNSILEDGSLKSTDGGDVDKDEERSDPADVDLAKILKHRSKVLCKNIAVVSSRAASKTSKVTSRAAIATSKAAVHTSKVVGQTSSSVAKSSRKRLGLTRSSIAKSSKKGIGSVSSRLASKKARAADPTSKAVSSTSKVAEHTSSSTAKSSKKGLSRGSALKRVDSMRGSALKSVGSMRGKFSKSKKDGATKTTGDYNIISSTNSESSYPLNGGSVQPEEQKSNSSCNIFEGIFCCFD